MTIDWLKDKETGIKFYPVTHEDAVIDSNGNTLSTNLGNKSDKSTTVTNVSYDSTSKKIQKTINNTTTDVVTLATVATSGSYNDLNNKPTVDSAPVNNSTNLVTSGGVYNAIQTILETSDSEDEISLLVTPILYEDLKDLRDNSQLVPGMYYRITDYETFVSGSLKSAKHLFDVIIMALTENTLSEDAYACKSERDNEMTGMNINEMNFIRYSVIDGDYQNEHYYGFIFLDNNNVLYIYTKDITTTPETIYGFQDSNNNLIPITDSENIANVVSNNVVLSCTFGYFTNSNLAAWKLKYCLEGNGKYEWEGSLTPPYVTYDGAYGNYVRNSHRDQDGLYCWTYYGGREDYHIYTASDFPQVGDLRIYRNYYRIITVISSDQIQINGKTYTRNNSYDTSQLYSWVASDDDIYYTDSETPSNSQYAYYSTYIGAYITEVGDCGNKGVIYQMIDEFNNNCPYDFKNIIYDDNYTFNIGNIGDGENESLHLTIDNSLNIFRGIYCYNNLISSVTFGYNNYVYPCNYFVSNYCYGNILESRCNGNMFHGNYTINNTLKQNCEQNQFNNSGYNIIGAGCHHNTFGYDFYGNIIGNGVNSCYFGPECQNNVIGTGCSYIRFFHTYLQNVEIGANCDYIYIEKDYVQNIIVEPGNTDVTITSTQTTSESNKLQNFTIAQGVAPSGTTKTISHNTVNDTFRTVYQPVNSVIVSV